MSRRALRLLSFVTRPPLSGGGGLCAFCYFTTTFLPFTVYTPEGREMECVPLRLSL